MLSAEMLYGGTTLITLNGPLQILNIDKYFRKGVRAVYILLITDAKGLSKLECL